jgi:hypothetical protein
MEPDREDRSVGPVCLRDDRLRDEWRRRSLATGWRMPDDWDSEAVGEVLAACRNRALARGKAGLAAVGVTTLTAACAGLGRSRARAGVGIAETIDDLAALFAVLGGGEGNRLEAGAPGGDPLLRLVGAIAEGWAEESVSQYAHGGETLSLAKPGPAIALVQARGDLPLRYARLRRNIQAAFGTQIRMTPLPGQLTEALRLVDELAR